MNIIEFSREKLYCMTLLLISSLLSPTAAPAFGTEVEAESYRYGRLHSMRTQPRPYSHPVYHSLFQQRAALRNRNGLYGMPTTQPAAAPAPAAPAAAAPASAATTTSATPVKPAPVAPARAYSTAPASAPAPANNPPSQQQPIIIKTGGKKESGMDLFMKYLPFIILILSLAIIGFLIFIFRDKIPACVSACEVCCEWTWRIILWPFKMLWRAFKFCFYPIKESCVECYTSCYDCFNPQQVKI